MSAIFKATLLLIIIALTIVAVVAFSVTNRGLSTRVPPTAVEAAIARLARKLATPREMRSASNPVEPSPAVLADALAHFADHCAVCHANDGSGDTDIGRSLYPPAPDMRAALTQQLSDGELFSIIERGIRLTGMPAWGDGSSEGERSSWALVHFIRRLSALAPEEITRMESLNPRSPQEIREEDEIRRFLEGETQAGAPEPEPGHKGHQ